MQTFEISSPQTSFIILTTDNGIVKWSGKKKFKQKITVDAVPTTLSKG